MSVFFLRHCCKYSLLFVWVAPRLLHADTLLSTKPIYPILLQVDLPPHLLGCATALCLSPIGQGCALLNQGFREGNLSADRRINSQQMRLASPNVIMARGFYTSRLRVSEKTSSRPFANRDKYKGRGPDRRLRWMVSYQPSPIPRSRRRQVVPNYYSEPPQVVPGWYR